MNTKSAAWWQEKIEKFQAEGRSRTTDTGLYFDDDFSPSHSMAKGEAPEKWANARTRPVFHNNHLFDFLGFAIEVAQDLRASPLVYGFPIKFTGICSADYETALQRAALIAEKLPAESPEWLAVTCYIQWLNACYCATIDGPVQEIAKWMFLAGATSRELELSIINRSHASRGRKVIKAASVGGDIRAAKQKSETRKVLDEMSKLLKERPNLSATSAAKIVYDRKIGTSPSANRAIWQRNKAKSKKL